jgi:hypothetical protein
VSQSNLGKGLFLMPSSENTFKSLTEVILLKKCSWIIKDPASSSIESLQQKG